MKKDNALPEPDPSDTPEDPPPEDTKPVPEATDLPGKEAQKKSEELVVEKKSAGGRRLLLILFLLITGGAGYYYAQKMGVSIPFLSELRKSSVPAIKESPAPVSTPSEPTKTGSPASVIEQDKEDETNPEETVKILREEIQSLKEELARVEDRQSPEELQDTAQPIDVITAEEESEEETTAPEEKEFVEQEEKPVEPQSEMKIVVTPSPVPATPRESSPEEGTPHQRSKEVQAYLDFIENMGNKLFDWVRKGWEMAWELVMSRTSLGKENASLASSAFSR